MVGGLGVHLLEDRRFYVYAHSRKSDGEIFYVGKGHGRRAYNLKNRSALHKRVTSVHGCAVHILESNLTETEAFARERDLILEAKTIALCMANMTDGGEGQLNPTVETRFKIGCGTRGKPRSDMVRAATSKALKGRKQTPEHIAAARAARIYKPHTAESRRRMSEKKQGKVMSEATRARMSASQMGRTATEVTREKLRNRVFSEAHRNALSAASKGKGKSEAHRLAMCAGKAKYWAARRVTKLEG
jgi:hypothetical protein